MEVEKSYQLVVQPSTSVATTWDPQDPPLTTTVSGKAVLGAHATLLDTPIDVWRSIIHHGFGGTGWMSMAVSASGVRLEVSVR